MKEYKVCFISDLHGLDGVELGSSEIDQQDHVVYLGDFVDSFFVTASEQLYNLNNLCKFKREHKDKVTLLLGNHCYAYIYNINSISGKQFNHISDYKKIYQDNIDLFQVAWGYTNPDTKKYTLSTHAGLTKSFYNTFVKNEIKPDEMMHEAINRLQDNERAMWAVGHMRGGRGIPGILWADYQEVLLDRYDGINQVFGHTPHTSVIMDKFGDDIVACVDNWGNKKVVSLKLTL